ncbi:MAG: radical SAM protein [Chitinophagales bacterium]|nr:radical SAM protein [Chitinophagales bacterium]
MINIIESIKTRFQQEARYREAESKGFKPLNKGLYKKYNSFRPEGGKPIFCYLPYNSLTFSFTGKVFVCGYNREILLGKYPQNTIDEIWNGSNAKKLREHMSHNDLEFGCQHCKYFFDKEKFTNLRPLVFDKYYNNTEALFPKVFEFELSNECNLECQMCQGEVSSSIRKNKDKLPPIPMVYDDAFVEQLAKYIPHLKEAKFYGGEPFLIPIYYKIWEKVRELNPSLELFLITNGMHWNSKIEKLVTELNFDLAVSIDAMDKEKLERIRKNVVHEKLLDNIKRFSDICTKKGKHLSLSFTVQKDNWDQLPLVIKHCNEVNAFIYVSYLERPIHYSLTDMSKAELKEVRAYMEKFNFPIFTQKERHNKKCFEDFKHFLDTYINNEEETRYHEYRFDSEKLFEEMPEVKQQVLPEISLISESQWLEWVDKSYQKQESYALLVPKEIFIRKINAVMEQFSDNDRQYLKSTMVGTSFDQILESVKHFSEEELRRLSLQQLNRIRAGV